MGFSLDDIKSKAFHLKVKGAYVQDPGDKGQVVGVSPKEFLFSVDATSLYPSTMITNNISEETLIGKVYDDIIINKLMVLIQKTLEPKAPKEQMVKAFENAILMQFKEYGKINKIAKQKETVEFNVKYYSYLFRKLITNAKDFDSLIDPKDDKHYHLLKSYLMPIMDAITWTSPLYPGYSITIVDYIFFPELFEQKYQGAWVIENIYSPKTKLTYYKKDDLIKSILQKYLLNAFGTLFYKHKDKLSKDVLFLDNSMVDRKKIKNRMLVFEQLLKNIESGNQDARKLAELLLAKDYNSAVKLIESAGINKIMESKKVKIDELIIEGEGDIVMLLELTIFTLNLTQLAIKVFMNSAFGIKGLISFPFSAPALGNSITTAAKIYGIKVAQVVATQVIENWKAV